MTSSRITEEPIVGILREQAVGTKTAYDCGKRNSKTGVGTFDSKRLSV